MTYGYCCFHELECDYDGQCVKCPYNSEKDTELFKEWFKQDEEQAESEEA